MKPEIIYKALVPEVIDKIYIVTDGLQFHAAFLFNNKAYSKIQPFYYSNKNKNKSSRDRIFVKVLCALFDHCIENNYELIQYDTPENFNFRNLIIANICQK